MSKTKIKQPRKELLYQLQPMAIDGETFQLTEGPRGQIVGNIEGLTIVTVPIETSIAAATELQNALQEKLGKEVLILTNNVRFVKAIPVEATPIGGA